MPPFLITMFAWMAKPIGKAVLWGIGALAGIAMITAIYFSITNLAAAKARLEAEVAAKELVITEQNQTIAHQKALMILQAEFSKKLDDDVAKIDQNAEAVNAWIQSKDAMASDRPSSLILKKTIEKLGVD